LGARGGLWAAVWLMGLALGMGQTLPSPGAIWAGYGDIYLERGEVETALHLYQRALELDPDLQEAAAGEAAALALLERREEALSKLDAYLERHPDSPLVLHVRGQVRFLQGWVSGAYRDLKRAYELNPAEPLYALAYARAAVVVGAWGEGRAVLSTLLEEGVPKEIQDQAVSLLYLLLYLSRSQALFNERGSGDEAGSLVHGPGTVCPLHPGRNLSGPDWT